MIGKLLKSLTASFNRTIEHNQDDAAVAQLEFDKLSNSVSKTRYAVAEAKAQIIMTEAERDKFIQERDENALLCDKALLKDNDVAARGFQEKVTLLDKKIALYNENINDSKSLIQSYIDELKILEAKLSTAKLQVECIKTESSLNKNLNVISVGMVGNGFAELDKLTDKNTKQRLARKCVLELETTPELTATEAFRKENQISEVDVALAERKAQLKAKK